MSEVILSSLKVKKREQSKAESEANNFGKFYGKNGANKSVDRLYTAKEYFSDVLYRGTA